MKMNLENLKIKSFVTQPQNRRDMEAINGGSLTPLNTFQAGCETSPIVCDIVTENCPTFFNC